MKSHIGCICLTFLHCGFSYVSSNGMPEQMHNHTGCICLSFPHCAFSNVPSNGLCERTHSCTDCICSILCHFLSFSWRFPHSVCSSRDFQEFLPFPFSALNCAAPNGYFLILRQILGSRRYKISEEKGKWKYQKFCSPGIFPDHLWVWGGGQIYPELEILPSGMELENEIHNPRNYY